MVDENKLDPNIKAFLDKINNAPKEHGFHPQVSVEEGRRQYLMFALTNAGWPLLMPRVEDQFIPSSDWAHKIPIRVYTPDLDKKLPALVYYHGGGWQRGDLATHDSICRHFAKYSGCIVVSVQWRLAPENKFPIGLNDCLDAYQWIVEHADNFNIDVTRVGIGGDSAGGNMTAVTVQRLRTLSIQKPIFQLLLYPALNMACDTPSYIEYAEGFFLTTERVKYYINSYLKSPEEIHSPLCSPLKAKDVSDLPPTHIVTDGFDPLRDDGELYAKRLKDAGVQVTYKCYEPFVHAFLHMNYSVPAVEGALQEISGVIKKALQNV